MGTQQILLIVLSVIIVGVAIAVGITMFQTQAYNSNKTAIAGEAQQYAAQIAQWYKTPVSMGGAGAPDDLSAATITAETIGAFIGFGADDTDNSNGSDEFETETGVFTLTKAANAVTITGVGKEERGGKNPQIVTVVAIPALTITATATDVDAS